MSDSPPADRETETPWSVLRQRAVRGSLWWAALFPFSKGIQVVGNVILSHLLAPSAFGVVAIASVILRGVQMFTEIGVGYALIQSPRSDERFINTAWTMQIGRGVLVCSVVALLAYPVAALYDEPQISLIMPVIGLAALASGLQSTKFTVLNRTLQERPRAVLALAYEVVTRAAMVAIAMIWPSAFALVLGILTGDVFFAIATHFLPGVRNRLRWDTESARAILRLGSWITAGTVIAYLGGQADALVLGKIVSNEFEALGLVGVYLMAQRVARLPVEAADILGSKLYFPILAEVARRERGRFRERLTQVQSAILPGGVALCLGVIVFAPWFFAIFYDERYSAARWIAPLMVASVWTAFLEHFTNKALMSLGRTRTLALTGGLRALFSVGGALVGFHFASVPGFILGLAAGDVVQLVVELVALARAGVAVHSQHILFSLVLSCAGVTCALSHDWAANAEPGGSRWSVFHAIPVLCFIAASGWATRAAWGIVRPRR